MALLDAAAVLCVPSRRVFGGLSEGSPLVVLEALARGLPVVATSVGGIPELCPDDGRVELVEANSPIALCEALERVFDEAGPVDTPVERVC
jgi:glycosyltransferase involved in cell wall biosynthesis